MEEGHGFALGNNYPNPCRTGTSIPFTLPGKSEVRLRLYNLLGEEVMVLFDGQLEGGTHEVGMDASKIAPGIYHYRLNARSANYQYESNRMMIISR